MVLTKERSYKVMETGSGCALNAGLGVSDGEVPDSPTGELTG